jgi:hypothetical protein
MSIAICPECRKVINFNIYPMYTSRPLPTYDHAEEICIPCPFCDHMKHSHFLNADLRAMHYDDAPREYRREYAKKFKKYQKVMLKRYYPSEQKRRPAR